MSAPPPVAGELRRDASRTKLAQNMGELCPDEIEALAAFRGAGVYISPSRLHKMYVRVMASHDADFDFGGHVLTMIRNRRSVPVDLQTGERAVKRMMHDV